ncbi:efflux RND transporter periplasmic adaptor subunit [Teredinibacter waterburyi]|uniref:efflux RND transporter periplasmic adaptor subunit n=1 Tax=Teredinibacter waterburyi TaxID=1500538 RepID=UPI00165F948C|nr:efflux RND transporter periplasmic adaptor subunit [Teredinibacter waterburyi]
MKSPFLRRLLPFIALAICLVIAAIFILNKKPPEKKPDSQDAPLVTLTPVTLGSEVLLVQSQGVVQAKYQTALTSQVSGKVVSVSEQFVRGGMVKKGDLLAQIDPFDYEVRLQQANASLASARAAFILERAQGQVAEAEWAKITNSAPSELGLRKPQQEQALAAVKAAEAGLQQAKKDLERTKIVAPFDALIEERLISPGGVVNIGTQLGRVLALELAEIRLPIANAELTYLNQLGKNAEVWLTATRGGELIKRSAKIVRDEGVVSEANRMVYLVAALADPYALKLANSGIENAQSLPFGTYVSASITGKQLDKVALIPRNLVKDGRVAIYKEGKLAFVDVDVLRNQGKLAVIGKGLANGDQLVTSSLQYPIAGMALQPREKPAVNNMQIEKKNTAEKPSSEAVSTQGEG